MADSVNYIAWADENLKARQQFFANLLSDDLAKEFAALKPKRPSKVKSQEKSAESQQEIRRSSRSTNKITSYNEASLRSVSHSKSDKRIAKCNVTVGRRRERFENLVTTCLSKTAERGVKEEGATFGCLAHRYQVSSVSYDVVCSGYSRSIAVYPKETSKLLAAVGDSIGIVSIFMEVERTQHLFFQEFTAHENSCPVTGLFFGSNYLLSCSEDGTLRKIDIERTDLGFATLYNSPGIPVTCMAIDSFDDIWFGQTDGGLVRFDLRSSSQCGYFSIDKQYGIKSLSTSKNGDAYLCAATTNGQVSIWDVRFLQKPIVQQNYPMKLIDDVSVSPTDPTIIFLLLSDGSIQVRQLDKTARKFHHVASFDCSTDLKKYRPAFHPNNGQVIAVSGRGELLSFFEGEDPAFRKYNQFEVSSAKIPNSYVRLAFHPTLPALVGANLAHGASIIRF